MRSFENGEMDGALPRRRPRRLSQLFAQLARDADGPVSIASLRDSFGDRSFAALLVLFGAFNLLPLPPGATAFLGLPLVIVSAQMMYGSRRAWLPRFLRDRSISAETFRAIMERMIPRLVRLERMIQPRYWPFWRRQGDRVIGVMSFILGILITLPIPFGNWLPALSTVLLGLALVERDGVLFALGTAVGIIAIVVIVAVFGSATALVAFFWSLFSPYLGL
jgi:hypothetical protein